jgi:hypothetical protein
MTAFWLTRLRGLQLARALAVLARRRQDLLRGEREHAAASARAEAAGHASRSLAERRNCAHTTGAAAGLLAVEAGNRTRLARARAEAQRVAREISDIRRELECDLARVALVTSLRRAAERSEQARARAQARRRENREEERRREERAPAHGEEPMQVTRKNPAGPKPIDCPNASPPGGFRRWLDGDGASPASEPGWRWMAMLPAPRAAPPPDGAPAPGGCGPAASLEALAGEIERAVMERWEGPPALQAQLRQSGLELRLCGGAWDGLCCRIRVVDGAVECRLREASAPRRIDLAALARRVARRLSRAGLKLGRWEVQS